MKRNSTTLYLTSPGSTTPLPWVNNAPDFSGFTDPTLSVLQQSWADFLASGQDLEVIPDPPPPALEPDWKAFNTAMLSDPDWRPWITQDMILMSATTSASMASDATQLQTAIELAVTVLGAPDPVAVQRWQGLADQYNIPISFGVG